MEEVIRIFNDIKNTDSLKCKEAIIYQNKYNKLFLKCLQFLLSPNIVTGISEKKIHKNMMVDDVSNDISGFEEIMEYIECNNSGRDNDIAVIQNFINKQNSRHKDFYEQMITKTFRLGCNSKVVNKVIPNLIPTFNVMLGTPIEKCKIKDGELIFLSRKLNGTRAAFLGNKFMTRQGKEYVGLDHIINDLQKIGYEDYFIDGELLYKNDEHLTDSEAFQKGTGIAMSKDANKSQLKLVVFDIVPLKEFWDEKSENTYAERRKDLELLQLRLKDFSCHNVEVVENLYQGTDHSEIWKWLDYAEENDWEGIMVNLNTPYECKRTKTLIKVKKFRTCDVECIGIEEGAGRNKGTLGALVCDYKGNKVNVGSGFSDSDRKHLWLHPENVIGHIVSVKYKEETKNKDGGISIQFPVFEGIRFDKDTPSYN